VRRRRKESLRLGALCHEVERLEHKIFALEQQLAFTARVADNYATDAQKFRSIAERAIKMVHAFHRRSFPVQSIGDLERELHDA
jgi:hypothetical protein